MDWTDCSYTGNDVSGLGAAQINCLEPLFKQVITVVVELAGFVFFIMLIVGGFRYLFSSGNPKATEAAKGTLTAAFLGLALVVAAFIILNLITGFTGLPLTTFKIWQF
jgi:TRAP-type C4-dicarboxylate transport system permease small subunit